MPRKKKQPVEESKPAFRAGFAAIIGKPNVGKSTLMNYFIGDKVAIVSDKPQTTRRLIRGILTRDDAQVVFIDTPGIHRPQHALGKHMVRAATQSLEGVDVIVFVVDGSRMPTHEDEEIADLLKARARAPILLVLNKMDLLKREMVGEVTEAFLNLVKFDDWMRTSVTREENLDKLLNQILARLPAGEPLFDSDALTDLSMQWMAAEFIREPILQLTRQEIPHAVAVGLEEWQDRSEKLTFIAATIWVEKDSQKSIIIGEGGSMLKKIGQLARKEIERMVGHSIFLELTVRVREKWRRDEQMLNELGYGEGS